MTAAEWSQCHPFDKQKHFILVSSRFAVFFFFCFLLLLQHAFAFLSVCFHFFLCVARFKGPPNSALFNQRKTTKRNTARSDAFMTYSLAQFGGFFFFFSADRLVSRFIHTNISRKKGKEKQKNIVERQTAREKTAFGSLSTRQTPTFELHSIINERVWFLLVCDSQIMD